MVYVPEIGTLPALAFAFICLLVGCASPGQPRPPSLQLPQIVDDLSAERAGDTVHLRWTTSSTTTDNLPVGTQISAVLYREITSGSTAGGHSRCIEIKRLPVNPGPAEADDALPPAMTTEPVVLLAYRLEILNRSGRSAGQSAEVFAAAGAAPPPVQELQAAPIRGGVRLGWKPDSGADAIELDRIDLARAGPRAQPKTRRPALPALAKTQPEVHLSAGPAGEPDAGGTLDRSVEKGASYRYTAQRVRPIVAEGHTLAIRSMLSPAVTVAVLDTFPPRPPTGLEAAAGSGDQPSIDLSWEPGPEADLAGYNIYRSELPASGTSETASWRRLNSVTVAVPGFTDAQVRAGTHYGYRVTSVDAGGNESAPGNEVQQTPTTR